MKSPIIRDMMPCSPLKVNQRFDGTCRLRLQSRRINQAAYYVLASCLAYSSTVKMEATCSS
jgi:hypothetical protein